MNSNPLIVKVHLKTPTGSWETRRFSVPPGERFTFEHLRRRLDILRGGKDWGEYDIMYVDSDQELITVSTDMELEEAINQIPTESRRVLRLIVGSRDVPQSLLQSSILGQSCNTSSTLLSSIGPDASSTNSSFMPLDNYLSMLKQVPQHLSPGDTPVHSKLPGYSTPASTSVPSTPSSEFGLNSSWRTKEPPQSTPTKVHETIRCDGCSVFPIVGPRYKCQSCSDYDLCQSCYHRGVHSEMSHPFLQMVPTENGMSVTKASPAMTTRPATAPPTPAYTATFIGDKTFADGTEVKPGTRFDKVWTIKNDGISAWPANSIIKHTKGDFISDGTQFSVPSAKPGESVDISVPIVAPIKSGRYISYFSLATPEGVQFGQQLWVDIIVTSKEDEPATPTLPEQFPYMEALSALKEMGFQDDETTRRLLIEKNGDLKKTLDALLKALH